MVSYLRVSRDSQRRSGLGIDAQRTAVGKYVSSAGCDLLAQYVETETGKKHDLANRPELRHAIAHAKRSRAILVVAKLDRLLRSTVVRTMLKTSGVRFVACDNPNANELTIDILAAVAENEVREIAKRTKEALAELKADGVKLGSHRPECKNNLRPEAAKRGRAIGSTRVAELAREAYSDLTVRVRELRNNGQSFRQIAANLDRDGHTTRTGKPWNATQVSRVLTIYSKA